MNMKRYLIGSLAVFAFIFIFDWAFHGVVLRETYQETSHLWRPENEAVFSAMLCGQALFALIFSFIFIKGYEGRGIPEGIRYGLLIGLLLVPGYLTFYAVQPYPFNLIVYWSVGGIIELMAAGGLLSSIYTPTQ